MVETKNLNEPEEKPKPREVGLNALVVWFRRLFCLHVDFVESGILDQTGLRLGLTCYTCVDCGKKKFFKEPPINMTI